MHAFIMSPRFALTETPVVPEHHEKAAAINLMIRRFLTATAVDPSTTVTTTLRHGKMEAVDLEDWIESAAMILAVFDTGRPVYLATKATDGSRPIRDVFPDIEWEPAANDGQMIALAGAPVPCPPETSVIDITQRSRFASRSLRTEGGPMRGYHVPPRSDLEYIRNPAYTTLLGRDAVLAVNHDEEAELGPDDLPDLYDACLTMARKHGRFVVKAISNIKENTILFSEEDENWTEDTVRRALYAHFEYTLERTTTFLVQAPAEINYEMRVIVIDGKPICSAGCIESMTPVFNESLFDPKLEKRRGDGVIVSRPDLVAEMIDFACDAWRKMNRESSLRCRHVDIDVG